MVVRTNNGIEPPLSVWTFRRIELIGTTSSIRSVFEAIGTSVTPHDHGVANAVARLRGTSRNGEFTLLREGVENDEKLSNRVESGFRGWKVDNITLVDQDLTLISNHVPRRSSLQSRTLAYEFELVGFRLNISS